MAGGARPGAGRRPKAAKLKALEGTARPDREPAVPDHVPIGAIVAPADLTDRELHFFGQVARILDEQKRSSAHYEPIVTLLARRMAQVERLSAVIELMGDTFESKSVKGTGADRVVTIMVRARPEAAMRSEAMRHVHTLLSELMLSPASALKIAEGKQPEEDPYADF